MPKVSIIIAYYRNIGFLKLVLKGFCNQSENSFEVIIAEDDNTLNLDQDLQGCEYIKRLNIQHVNQENKGFRKCRILNKAINCAKSDYIVFIDGDCIPHQSFVKEYIKIKDYDCVFGRRVMLNESYTNTLVKQKEELSIAKVIFNSSKTKHAFYIPFREPTQESNKGIWGCNWGLHKKYLEQVNGFDMDYQNAGVGEDVDIEWRLRAEMITIHYVKHRPIVYHLHHSTHYDNSVVQKGMKLLESKKRQNLSFCLNGLNQV